MKDIIYYYEDGGKSNMPAAERTEMRRQAREWQKMLNKEFYKEGNAIGRRGMYLVLKKKSSNDYPTKRFVGAWLRRQISNQVNRTAPKEAPSIQAVITSKPNELIQIDYMYFYRHLTGELVIDEPKEGETSEAAAERRKEAEKTNQLLEKQGIVWQGCITAIDCFSRVGYAIPIRRNINSAKAWSAFKEIQKEAEKRYGTKIKKIQTDKGSEFMLKFRDGLTSLNEDNPGFYKHVFGYTGRSQTQGIVERFNGTLKRMLMRNLNHKIGTQWNKSIGGGSATTHLEQALVNYNGNNHRVIKMSPDEVTPANYKEVKGNILERAKRHKRFQGVVYKPGDFVRLKVYKPKRMKPSFTWKEGPLYEMTKDRRYHGIYMVTHVNVAETTKIAKATTYTIIARWSKESSPDWSEANPDLTSVPSGIKLRKQTVNIHGSVFHNEVFPKGSYPRKFVKAELVRVPIDRKTKKPIVEGDLDREVPEVVKPPKPVMIVPTNPPGDSDEEDEAPRRGGRVRKKTPSYKTKTIAKTKKKKKHAEYEVEAIVSRRKFKDGVKYKVKWKGYDDDDDLTWEPLKNLGSAMKMVSSYEASRKS